MAFGVTETKHIQITAHLQQAKYHAPKSILTEPQSIYASLLRETIFARRHPALRFTYIFIYIYI